MACALAYLESAPTPRELRLARQRDRWESLPKAGGTDDQEAGLLDRMAWASATYNAFRGYNTAPKLAQWIGANPEAYDLYKYVIELLEADDLI